MKNARDAVSSYTRRTVVRATLGSLATGLIAGTAAGASNATDYADNFQTKFNGNATAIKNYGNDRLSGSETSLEMTFTDSNGNSAKRYLVTTTDSLGDFKDVEVVTPSTFDDLGRTVDYTATLYPYAAGNAASELGGFVENFVPPNQDPSQTYTDGLDSDYDSEVDGVIFDDMISWLGSLS